MSVLFPSATSIDLGSSPTLNVLPTLSVSIVGWFITTDEGKDKKVFSKQDNGYKMGQNSRKFEFETRSPTRLNRSQPGGTVCNNGQLYHAAGVTDGNVLTMGNYVDGVAERFFSPASAMTDHENANARIGAESGGNMFNWIGHMEDVRVYNRLLSAAEVATIHAMRGRDGIVDGLIGRWPMLDMPPGTTVVGLGILKDLTGNNNGTGSGSSPTFDESVGIGFRRRVA